MATPGNVLDRLAQAQVPPMPVNLKRRVHDRLNAYLLVGHLLDVLLRLMPYALFHFLRAACAGIVFSITGKFVDKPPGAERPDRT